MTERVENALQIAVLLICASVALARALKYRSRGWTHLVFFYGSLALGDIYWFVYLLFFGVTPQISVVSDISWFACYIFLYLLLIRTAPPIKNPGRMVIPWIGPLFTASSAVFFMLRGEIFLNLIYAGLMGLLMFSSLSRLTRRRSYERQFFLSFMILVFCLIEYGLWFSSCFFDGDTLANPYYWFDILFTASFVLFIPATKKAVTG